MQRTAKQKNVSASDAPTAPTKAAPQVDFSRFGSIYKRPLTELRKVIAQRMTENWNTIPHVTQFDEADLTNIMELRKKYADAYEKKGTKLTVTSFAIKAVLNTLKKHPIFNTSLDGVSQEIIFKEYLAVEVFCLNSYSAKSLLPSLFPVGLLFCFVFLLMQSPGGRLVLLEDCLPVYFL